MNSRWELTAKQLTAESYSSHIQMGPRISVFPKCYFDDLVDGRRSYEQWIRDAGSLGGEGVEHYDGFFRSLSPADVDPIVRVMAETGQISSMVCFSPDFTHPDPDSGVGKQYIPMSCSSVRLRVLLGLGADRTRQGGDGWIALPLAPEARGGAVADDDPDLDEAVEAPDPGSGPAGGVTDGTAAPGGSRAADKAGEDVVTFGGKPAGGPQSA